MKALACLGFGNAPLLLFLLLWALSLAGCGNGEAVGTPEPTDRCGNGSSDQTGVQICSFRTDPQEVLLINYTDSVVSLNNWKLQDQSAHEGGGATLTFGASDSLRPQQVLTIGSLPFTIDSSGETLYLIDDTGILRHQKR